MNSVLTNPSLRLRCWIFAICALWLCRAQPARALDILRLDETVSLTQASIATGQIFSFRIRYNCASTSDSAISAVISSVLDPSFELAAIQGSAHTASTSFDAATSTVRFIFNSPLIAGSTGELFIQAKFKYTTPVNTVGLSSAVFSAGNAVSQTSNQVSVTAIDPPVITPPPPPPVPTFTPGPAADKWGPASITPTGPYLGYQIRHGNAGDTADALTSYTLEDPLPAGTSLYYIGTDYFYGTNQAVTLYYKTNLSGAWRQWGAGARYHTGDARTWIYADELGLPATEWVTALKCDYGTLPGGGAFLPANMGAWLDIVALMRKPADFTPGVDIVNCATVAATGYTKNSCATTQVLPAVDQPYLYAGVEGAHGQPFAIGETLQAQAHLGVGPSSASGMEKPVIYALLPAQVSFTGAWRMRWWPTGAANVAPVFTSKNNFGAPGQTLLTWSWESGAAMVIPSNRTWNELMVEADVTVNSRTPNGDYKIQTWAGWAKPGMNTGDQEYCADLLDVDRDGNVLERFACHSTYFRVETGNGVAGLESTMFVKGGLDAAWTKFPAIGQTVPGGKADYELHIKNIGGIVMRDAVIVDILPIIGDTGVIDLTPRRSLWSPFLVEAVAAPAGVTVLYSNSKNPCRPELVPSGPPGCEAPNWTSVAPDDITTVRSLKFDLSGLDVFPGDDIVLTWPMRAPWGAPTTGEVAWNSFGFFATRADNGNSLLASEPVKTGIAIQRPVPPYYGDFVWMDTNKDGKQDGGESGLNGVRVELFRDNGDNIADPATDTFVSFTATYREKGKDGAYLFGNMGVGSYYAVILAPNDTGVTLPNTTADDQDSDGTSIIYKNRRAAIMPVTRLDALEEDRTWDQGFYSRSGIPAVWAVSHLADGRMYIGGKFAKSHGVARNNIARLTAAGDVDAAFSPGSGFNGPVRSLAVRSDGMVWVGGNFSSYNGFSTKGVALLAANGTFDSRPARPDTQEVNWVAAAGTRMYLAGAFGKVGGKPCGNIARLNEDGSFDPTFATGTGANGTIYSGEALPDGSVILVGAFSKFNDLPFKGIVKLKTDGSTDAGFNPRGGASGEVYSLKLCEDGRMTLTGSFTSFDGTPCNGTVRLLKTGRVDATMGSSTLNVRSINTAN